MKIKNAAFQVRIRSGRTATLHGLPNGGRSCDALSFERDMEANIAHAYCNAICVLDVSLGVIKNGYVLEWLKYRPKVAPPQRNAAMRQLCSDSLYPAQILCRLVMFSASGPAKRDAFQSLLWTSILGKSGRTGLRHFD